LTAGVRRARGATAGRARAQVRDNVAIHVLCSSKKMGIADAFQTVAGLCSHEVTNTGVPCCGAPDLQDHLRCLRRLPPCVG